MNDATKISADMLSRCFVLLNRVNYAEESLSSPNAENVLVETATNSNQSTSDSIETAQWPNVETVVQPLDLSIPKVSYVPDSDEEAAMTPHSGGNLDDDCKATILIEDD